MRWLLIFLLVGLAASSAWSEPWRVRLFYKWHTVRGTKGHDWKADSESGLFTCEDFAVPSGCLT